MSLVSPFFWNTVYVLEIGTVSYMRSSAMRPLSLVDMVLVVCNDFVLHGL